MYSEKKILCFQNPFCKRFNFYKAVTLLMPTFFSGPDGVAIERFHFTQRVSFFQHLRVTAIKKIHTGYPVFQRPLNCRVVCGTPFSKHLWVPIFSKNLPGTGIMYHTFFPHRSPAFCHILRVPGGVRHPSFVFSRQRVRAPGRSPCIIIKQRVREPGKSRIGTLLLLVATG